MKAEIATADVVAVTPTGNILLITREWWPFRGHLALPGGHVDHPEQPAEAAVRELKEETGVEVNERDLTEIGTYRAPGRDPRGPYVTTAYLAHVPATTQATAGTDARTAHWHPLTNLPPRLAFDHKTIITDARRLLA